MTKTYSFIAVSLIGCLGFLGTSSADRRGFGGKKFSREEMLQKFDANKDGQIDATEKQSMKAARKAMHAEKKAKMLAEFDANKNGALEDAERAQMHQTMAKRRFDEMDSNRDGQISWEEFKNRAKH